METNGIDLTKYNNLQFKALINGSISTGTIRQDGKTFISLTTMLSRYHMSYEEFLCLIESGNTTFLETVISDFEIVPRDPETYKDWQVGDLIWDSYESGNNGRIIFRSGDFVAADIDGCTCYTCEELFDDGYRLILTDVEQQIIEEKKKCEPQSGDIVAWKEKDDEDRSAISIYRKKNRAYFTLFVDGMTGGLLHNLAMNIVRPATDEEKQRLFDAMAKKGVRWNAEKKVVEDIPKPYEFKAKDIVMVRDAKERWKLMAFVAMGNGAYKYEVTNGEKLSAYKQCIPYNEKTMHLLGTSNDYMEE